MKGFLLYLFCSITFLSFSQESDHAIKSVAENDEALIGKRLNKVVKHLEIDTNFTVIFEPPGICRGIKTNEINGWQVQLIIERTSTGRHFRTEGIYGEIKNEKIIGVSWKSPHDCNSVGEVIWQFAFDQYGPCDE